MAPYSNGAKSALTLPARAVTQCICNEAIPDHTMKNEASTRATRDPMKHGTTSSSSLELTPRTYRSQQNSIGNILMMLPLQFAPAGCSVAVPSERGATIATSFNSHSIQK